MTTMLDPEWTVAQQVICTLFHVLAILSTSFRILYRLHTRRLWLEDACAALALVGDCICLALVWVPNGQDKPSRSPALVYIAASLPEDVVWMARMSILCSIIRMTNPKSLQRRLACATAVSFVVFWLVIFVQRMILCVHSSCGSDRLTGILQIIAALLSDIALIALPIWSFGASKLSRDRKITLVAVYIATIVITATIVFDSIEAILPVGVLSLLSTNLKPAVALTISNLVVITSWSWRLFGRAGRDRPRHRASPSSASNNNAATFTTVDLNTCLSGTAPATMDMTNFTNSTTDSTTNNSNSDHGLAFSPLAGCSLLPSSCPATATVPPSHTSNPGSRQSQLSGPLARGGDLTLAFSADA